MFYKLLILWVEILIDIINALNYKLGLTRFHLLSINSPIMSNGSSQGFAAPSQAPIPTPAINYPIATNPPLAVPPAPGPGDGRR